MGYKVQKPCKVCGKMYTPCADCENENTTFHWRTVVCSYECAMEYFRRVDENRKKNSIKGDSEIVEDNKIKTENIEHPKTKRVYKKKTSVEEDDDLHNV